MITVAWHLDPEFNCPARPLIRSYDTYGAVWRAYTTWPVVVMDADKFIVFPNADRSCKYVMADEDAALMMLRMVK